MDYNPSITHYGVDRDGESEHDRSVQLKRLSRGLVRVNFATKGPFEQDPTTSIPPYPTLEPATELPTLSRPERLARLTYLRRARNAVVYRLRETRTAIRERLRE